MKQTPIHEIASRIKRLSLAQQVHHLRSIVSQEKPHSVRRNDLEDLLKRTFLKQLKKENRAA